jgi:hypothetical protein
MCMSKPKIPAPVAPPPPPPPTQDSKLPETIKRDRKSTNSAPIAGGTLLTGPSGIASNQLPVATGTLLGG